MAKNLSLTGVERFFDDDDIIVSKTDLKGHLTYTNNIFLDISGYTEHETIGQPHSLIRHPEMPRSIFNLLWQTIAGGNEIFAYVNNRSKCGDNYWVYAHVTPSWNDNNEIIGYHSNRRVPDRKILDQHIIPLYDQLKAEEDKQANRKQGMMDGSSLLRNVLKDAGIAYDEFIATLGQDQRKIAS
ncbi:MAG: PAS domain-containing protein [Rhizobiales bacterium]|nr:PAS domain-containing protein [Hyphomicrobiales bacterium]NRB13959.1 PAS domain-containing protein [Hyphomicrobiales bacterium]